MKPGDGHFERTPTLQTKWRVQHAKCAIEMRGVPDAYTEELKTHQERRMIKKWTELAKGTGKIAQRARLRLRQRNLLPPGEHNAEERLEPMGSR